MIAMLLYMTTGLTLTLLLRRSSRRVFGAGPAFTLWALPPLLGMLAWMPVAPASWSILPPFPLLVVPSIHVAAVAPGAAGTFWAGLWLAGTALWLLRVATGYVGLRRQSMPLPVAMHLALKTAMPWLAQRRLRVHPAGPAVLWAPDSLLLVPADFFLRFDADERRLAMQHELMHMRRGDPCWNLLAEAMFALLWFHPLAWLSRSRFRLEMELACDEAVLRCSPCDTASYARALLHRAGAITVPALIPWLAKPQLKERLLMIKRQRPGALRRRIGFSVLTVLITGSVLATQAVGPTSANNMASADLAYNTHIIPVYPADAIKNQQQGMVVLDVLVGADGKPITIEVDPATHAAQSLVESASATAMQWHFKPPADSKTGLWHARVPVSFRMDATQATPSKPATVQPEHGSTDA